MTPSFSCAYAFLPRFVEDWGMRGPRRAEEVSRVHCDQVVVGRPDTGTGSHRNAPLVVVGYIDWDRKLPLQSTARHEPSRKRA